MSSVRLSGNASGTGVFTIASPNSNTNFTQTLPAETGTILTTATPGVPVNGPAFSAYRGTTTQAVSGATYTKIQFNLEEFDTNSNYDSTTNYRFTPTVAGYYQITLSIYSTVSIASNFYAYIYKNGANFKTITTIPTGGGSTSACLNGSALVYLNGSTDYVEGYYWVSQAATVSADSTLNYFQGALVRTA